MLQTEIYLTFWQVDPSEKLEDDVEDALIEIAEDFVESVSHNAWLCILSESYFN